MNAFTLKDFIEGGNLLLTYIVQKPIFTYLRVQAK